MLLNAHQRMQNASPAGAGGSPNDRPNWGNGQIASLDPPLKHTPKDSIYRVIYKTSP